MVMAKAICWRYSRVPVVHPRIMPLVDAERDTGGGEDADSVVSDKIGDAYKGGDSPGGGAPTGMVLDPDGKSILNSEKDRLKANGVQEVSLCLHPSDKFPLAKWEEGAAYWNQWRS